jgi:hypothetical protein
MDWKTELTISIKFPVTIDDYRATAFVQETTRQSTTKEKDHTISLMRKRRGKQSLKAREFPCPPGPFSRPKTGKKNHFFKVRRD